MVESDMQHVANAVIRRAQRDGFVVPDDIRHELALSGKTEAQWEQLVTLFGPVLQLREGRYYYRPQPVTRLGQERRQLQVIQQSVRRLIRLYKKKHIQVERRQQGRTDFVQAVKVRTEDNKELAVLSRDISETGICLISTRSLLGQKISVTLPPEDDSKPIAFMVRIVWTCVIGDGLFENGGVFQGLVDVPATREPLQPAGVRA